MRNALLAAASGALLLAAAPPLAASPVVLVAFVPLLAALRRAASIREAAALGWMTGALFYTGLLPWLPATIGRSQAMAWPAALLLFALFVGLHALAFAAVALVASAARTPTSRCIAVTAAWILVEQAFPQVLPWTLGAMLGPHPLLRQGADLVGARGLAALIIGINALVAEAAASWTSDRARAGLLFALDAAVMVAAAAYGRARLSETRPPRTTTGVALVQAGPSTDGADPQRSATMAWTTYAGLTTALAGRADLVIWPEGVLRVYLRAAGPWRAGAEALARRLPAALIVGALDRAADGGELTAAYVFTPSLSAMRYKRELVPFGEYMPRLVHWLPPRWWRPPAPRRAGPGAAVVGAGVRLAPTICFEAIIPGAFNAAARDGAEVLVNLSDDSWFDSAWAAAQHLEMTRLRAVETRRWLVRASHSGISAVVSPDGAMVATLPYGERGTIARVVERRSGVTPYARCGDAPLVGGSAAALLIVAGAGAWRRYQARSKSNTSASASARS